jgi:hypothetical protein
MFFLGQIGFRKRSSKVALKKKGALFGHSSFAQVPAQHWSSNQAG